MFEKIREMIAENLNIDINTITEEASFKAVSKISGRYSEN